MALHELRHVQADDRFLVIEEEARQLASQLRLPYPGGSEEDERADGTACVLEAGPRAADGLRDHLDRVLRDDQAGMHPVLHAEQAGRFRLAEAGDRHAGPGADDLGDVLLVDLWDGGAQLVAPFHLFLDVLVFELLLFVAEGGGGLVVLVGDRLFFLDLKVADLLLHRLEIRRCRRQLHADAGGCLIHQVDRLVRQRAVRHVAHRQLGRRFDGLVGHGNAVMLLVERLDAVQDRDRLDQRRLVDEDRLEAALEGRILLDVLAVLVERGGADALDLAACEGGLEDVGGIDRAFRRTRADQRMQLVDEEHHLATGADFIEDLLQALFDFAAVLGAGDERAHVEREHALSTQRLGDVAEHDLLGQSLGDRGLADAGLADQRRVVLGPAGQDLDDPLDLRLTADHRVERVLRRQVGEVTAELVEQRRLGRLFRGRRLFVEAALVQQAVDFAADLLQVRAQVLEDVGGNALTLDQEAEEQMLGADVVVAHPAGFLEGDLDDLLDARGGDDLLDDDAFVAAQHRLDGGTDLIDLDAEVVEHLGGESLAFAQQTKEQVLGADVRVVRALGLFLGERQDLLRSLRKSLKGVQPKSSD